MKQTYMFPIAMEHMPAAPDTLKMLNAYIRQSDVYVLLLGDQGGTFVGSNPAFDEISENNKRFSCCLEQYISKAKLSRKEEITYTEFEYILAKAFNLPILIFIKEESERVCVEGNASEYTQRFYNVVRSESAYKVWHDEENLLIELSAALENEIHENISIQGWVRENASEIYRSAISAGISNIFVLNSLNDEILEEKLAHADTLKVFFTTGKGFIHRYQTTLAQFVANGGNIKILCMRPYSDMLKDVQEIEEIRLGKGNREGIHLEFDEVISHLKTIAYLAKTIKGENFEYCCGKIEIGFASTNFRSSIIICENKKSNSYWGYFTITLPPFKSKDTVSFELISHDLNAESNNLLNRSMKHFDLTWDIADHSQSIIAIDEEDEIPVINKDITFKSKAISYWRDKQKNARQEMVKRIRNKAVLIEVAAQHPLVDGETPNDEFIARLDRAISIYEGFVQKDNSVPIEIYVPGSCHLDKDGISDLCSLSTAGQIYLISKGVPPEIIHGDDLNSKYSDQRDYEGVYNSADECFISAQYFKSSEKRFGTLISICSPNQSMRKTLFYLNQEIIPMIVTVPIKGKMYHNFIEELFKVLPNVLNEDHDWQHKPSKEAERTRKERMPK